MVSLSIEYRMARIRKTLGSDRQNWKGSREMACGAPLCGNLWGRSLGMAAHPHRSEANREKNIAHIASCKEFTGTTRTYHLPKSEKYL